MDTKQALLKLEDGVDDEKWGNDPGFEEALSALTALAEDHEKVKAEVEAMKPSCLTCFGSGKIQTHPTVVCPKCGGTGKEWSVAWKARAEKAEAEVERLRTSQAEINTGATKEVVRLQQKCKGWESKYLKRNEELTKAEAELARYRPLIKAVEKARKSTLTDDRVFWGVDEDAILRAALKCKEEK